MGIINGLWDFIIIKSAKNMCKDFNRFSLAEWIAMSILKKNQIYSNYSWDNEDNSEYEIAIKFVIYSIVDHEISVKKLPTSKYTANDYIELSKGYFELLVFTAAHGGDKQTLDNYRNSEQHLIRDCRNIYKYIQDNAPEAISLDYDVFFKFALLSLINTKYF